MKQYTKDIADKAKKAFAKTAEELKTKAKKDNRKTFEVIISTNEQDRHGDIVDQKGLDTTNYWKNPVVLLNHAYHELPIGIAKSIETREQNGRVETVAKGYFASGDANPKAEQVARLYEAGIITATSIGFIPLEWEGDVIKSSELLEFSFVGVPANPSAVSLRTLEDIGVSAALVKELGFEVKKGEEVDNETDDEPKEEEKEEEKADEEEEKEEETPDEDGEEEEIVPASEVDGEAEHKGIKELEDTHLKAIGAVVQKMGTDINTVVSDTNKAIQDILAGAIDEKSLENDEIPVIIDGDEAPDTSSDAGDSVDQEEGEEAAPDNTKSMSERDLYRLRAALKQIVSVAQVEITDINKDLRATE